MIETKLVPHKRNQKWYNQAIHTSAFGSKQLCLIQINQLITFYYKAVSAGSKFLGYFYHVSFVL